MLYSDDILQDFIKMSHTIGRNPAYVQGGGGNVSIKAGIGYMLIKASGIHLLDVTSEYGFSAIDYHNIDFSSYNMDEGVFTRHIQSCVVGGDNRPSIETGFHAILGTVVIHTHSVYANVLCCSAEGQGIASQLFPESLWVEYMTPGKELTFAISNALNINSKQPNIIFLQNHGLIISADNIMQALDLHEQVHNKIREYLSFPHEFDMTIKGLLDDAVLFPDQVVYTMVDSEVKKTTAAQETLAACTFIMDAIRKNRLTPHFLLKAQVDIIRQLESEKYRQKVVGS